MAAKRTDAKSWRAKLERDVERKVVEIDPRMQKRFGKGTMVIPRPLDVDALVRGVGKGRLVTIGQLRERLARDAGANVCCPFTSGIFLKLAAFAAEEDREAGRKRVTPYWRVVRDDGSLNDKFPDGVEGHARLLEEEGHVIVPGKGKKAPRVSDLEGRRQRL
jgi:hypothetical protein